MGKRAGLASTAPGAEEETQMTALSDPVTEPSRFLRHLFDAAVARADPMRVVPEHRQHELRVFAREFLAHLVLFQYPRTLHFQLDFVLKLLLILSVSSSTIPVAVANNKFKSVLVATLQFRT